MCPSCEQGGSRQLRGHPAPRWVPVFSAGDVLQLPLPLRGAGLLPGPGAAAARRHRRHPAHVHAQGRRPASSGSGWGGAAVRQALEGRAGGGASALLQASQEKDITLVWVKSEASGRR